MVSTFKIAKAPFVTIVAAALSGGCVANPDVACTPGLIIGCGYGPHPLASAPPQPAYNYSNATEQCRALQALIEARERYGIIAPSRGQDEDALRRCGLPNSGSDTKLTVPDLKNAKRPGYYSDDGRPYVQVGSSYAPADQAIPDVGVAAEGSRDVVQLKLHGGVFAVPVVINQAVSIPFVLDSGAAEVQLPAEVVLTLMRTGTLSEGDFIGASSYVLADGSTLRSSLQHPRDAGW